MYNSKLQAIRINSNSQINNRPTLDQNNYASLSTQLTITRTQQKGGKEKSNIIRGSISPGTN